MTLGTLPEWAALGPAGVLAATALLLLVVDAVDGDRDSGGLLAALAAGGGLATLGLTLWYLVAGTGQPQRNGAITLFEKNLVVDGMALFFTAIVASVVVLVTLASYDYLHEHPHRAEFYSLTLLSATGMALVAAANSFVVAFISIELVSLPSYALVASLKNNQGSVEAGLKYFLVGALSSAILAYGISLVYVATGSLAFEPVADAITPGGPTVEDSGILGFGLLMILGGFAFKMAAVPFHFWAPEAYEGAPAPVSAFLSSASKAAGFVITFRVFTEVLGFVDGVPAVFDWVAAVQVLAVVTMTVGNLAALRQEKVKRMLAYSSVGHAGFALIALAALTGDAEQAFVLGSGMVHLLVYGFMNTGAFLVIALGEYWSLGRRIEDYNGLRTQAPFAAIAMTVFLYSLAGLPVGAGFLSKFYLLFASLEGGVALLAVALVANSAVSVFYYSRVVKAMWTEEPADDLEITEYPRGLYAAIALALLATILLLPGFGVLVDVAETGAGQLFD
jgi:proton-translocating NADH-quinone oxidoreductase chain N